MKSVPVAIIGGGLSGLYAAWLLEQKDIDYVLLEARPTLGGRIITTKSSNSQSPNNQSFEHLTSDSNKNELADSFDLGPSWFWPDFQQQLGQLIDELQLESFAQFEEGDMMVERSSNELAMRSQGYRSSSPSMRLKGGMAALIKALYDRLDNQRVLTNQKVYQLNNTDDYIEVVSEDSFGQITIWQAQHLLLALPPRLAAASINLPLPYQMS